MQHDQAEEVAARIHSAVIPTNDYQAAYDAVIRLHTLTDRFGKPSGLTVKSQSGGGKTTLVRAIRDAIPPMETEEALIQPIVVVSIPPKPEPAAMGMAILDAMGFYIAANAKVRDINRSLITAFKESKTRMLIVDESQELVERGTQKQHMMLADWFKWLMNEAGVSIVLFGLPYLMSLLNVNSQLRRRFSETYTLSNWRLNHSDEMDEFQSVIYTLIDDSGYKGNCEILVDTAFLEQFHYATNGIIAHVVTVVAEAVRLAIIANHRKLKKEHFENAFKAKFWSDVGPSRNPFSKRFNGQPLTQYGEPFAEEV